MLRMGSSPRSWLYKAKIDYNLHLLSRRLSELSKLTTTDIVPYHLGAKVTVTFHKSNESFDENSYLTAQKLDLAYIVTKIVCASDETPMPGWTGFDTMLHDKIPNV